jgi:hypothetical protein
MHSTARRHGARRVSRTSRSRSAPTPAPTTRFYGIRPPGRRRARAGSWQTELTMRPTRWTLMSVHVIRCPPTSGPEAVHARPQLVRSRRPVLPGADPRCSRRDRLRVFERCPRWNRAPARMRATRCATFTARHRCWADSTSLRTLARAVAREPAPQAGRPKRRGGSGSRSGPGRANRPGAAGRPLGRRCTGYGFQACANAARSPARPGVEQASAAQAVSHSSKSAS